MTIDLVAELEALRPLADEGKLTYCQWGSIGGDGITCMCPMATIGVAHGVFTRDDVYTLETGENARDTMLTEPLADATHLSPEQINDLIIAYDRAVRESTVYYSSYTGEHTVDLRAALEVMIQKARELTEVQS